MSLWGDRARARAGRVVGEVEAGESDKVHSHRPLPRSSHCPIVKCVALLSMSEGGHERLFATNDCYGTLICIRPSRSIP